MRMLSPTDAAEAAQSLRESLVLWHWSLKGALKGHHEEAIPQFEGQRLHLQTHSPPWSWWGLCCLLCTCPPGGRGRAAPQGFRALFIVTTKNLVRTSFSDFDTAYLWSWWTSWDQAVLQRFWNLDLACPCCIILVHGVSKLWCQRAARHSSHQKVDCSASQVGESAWSSCLADSLSHCGFESSLEIASISQRERFSFPLRCRYCRGLRW